MGKEFGSYLDKHTADVRIYCFITFQRSSLMRFVTISCMIVKFVHSKINVKSNWIMITFGT